MDEPAELRLFFFMTALEPVIAHFPEKLLSEAVLPFLFGYRPFLSIYFFIFTKHIHLQCILYVCRLLSHNSIRLNKKAHRLFSMLFAGPHTPLPRLATPTTPPFSGMPPYVMKIIPYYLKVSLDHYSDTLLPFESFVACFQTIVTTLPHTHPLFIFCFEKLAEKILELERQASQQPHQHEFVESVADAFDEDKSQHLRSRQPAPPPSPQHRPQLQQLAPPAVSSKNLAMYLFSQLVSVDIQVLDLLLEIIATVIGAYDPPKRTIMCNYLYEIISRNFDYTRKSQCLNWYLSLVHQYGKATTTTTSLA